VKLTVIYLNQSQNGINTQWRTEGGFGVFNTPPEIPKALQNHVKTQPDF